MTNVKDVKSVDAILKYYDVDNVVLNYLEILDDRGIIEDYAYDFAIHQYETSGMFIYNHLDILINKDADYIINLVDSYCEYEPFEDNFDDYDDYIYEMEWHYNELENAIKDWKSELHSFPDRLKEDLEDNTIFSVVDNETGAEFCIPSTSKYYNYYYDVVYKYVNDTIANTFK